MKLENIEWDCHTRPSTYMYDLVKQLCKVKDINMNIVEGLAFMTGKVQMIEELSGRYKDNAQQKTKQVSSSKEEEA